ncbi:MAG: HlyC/CorC family transporter [Clostridia bacterium]|nr:HlyC/CorC family transporter [Clostridia bacterium]
MPDPLPTPSASTIILQVLLQLVLIFLNAVFACAEIAVIEMKGAKLDKLADDGDKRAKRLKKLTDNPAKFLASIQVAITLSGFLGSAFAAENFSVYIVNGLSGKIGLSDKTIETISIILITILLSYITLIFGELVPKRLAMKKSEKIALGVSGTVKFISVIFAPLVWLLTVSTNGVLRMMGIDPNSEEEEVTEEEIRMMVDAGSEKGTIDVEEKEIIQNVFEFDDITAGEISTHRTDIVLLWMDDDVSAWEQAIHENRHTFYPICEESVDNVVGILNAKDYFRLTDKSKENILAQAVKPAYLIPETVKADVLFKNMKKTRNYFAVVLDEYGGMSGIVTMTDILECIVGDFDDGTEEIVEPKVEIEKTGENTWRIDGSAPIEDVEETLGIDLDDSCDTFGGYVLGIIGTIPEDGTTPYAETERLKIQVTEISDHRIESANVELIESDNNEDEE